MNTFIGKNIKAVFFDHDDTLVGTFEAKSAHHKHVAKTHYGKDLQDEEIRLHWGKPLHDLLCILYGTDNAEEALAKSKLTHTEFPKILFDKSIEVLTELHKTGKLIGVITATTRFNLEYDLDLHKFPRKYIDYTQTADDTPYHKPDPRVFTPAIKWLKKHKVEPSEVVYIADGLHDAKAALGAGFHFIGVETGLTTLAEFTAEGIQSFPSIGQILRLF